MKKIVLLFAAVVLLASCVKENTLAPEQTGDNLVTIKALAMDTKTTLGETTDDQTAVLWEGNDKIMVVYENVDGDNNNDDIITEFAINGTPEGSSATFKGQYNSTGFPAASQTRPFAVYPSSSVTDNGQGKYTIKHNLPDVQDGKDLSGRLLSTAILKDEDLMAGTASATFKNALTLLYVTVPEGVTSVALTASYGIVGDATFTISNTYSSDSVWDDDLEDYVSDVTEATGKLTGSGNKKTVTLSNEGNELEAGTYPVLIYPGYTSTFTVTMTGTSDDVKFEKTLSDLTFTAGEYRNLNLTQIFQMEVKETETVSTEGGTVTVKIASALDVYDYTVSITNNTDPQWITYTLPTKSLHKEDIVFTVAENIASSSRQSEVIIAWTDPKDNKQKSKVFTISQAAALDMGIIEDLNGDPVRWEETFDLYKTLTDAQNKTNSVKSYKNVFTISKSGDNELQYGAYKIENMFYAENMLRGNKGGTYYADLDNGVLTVKTKESDGATRSYYFKENIKLIYDDVNKTFSIEAPAGFIIDPYNSALKSEGYIGNYNVKVKVPVDMGLLNSFVGTYTYSYNYNDGSNDVEVENEEFVVSVVDEYLLLSNLFPCETEWGPVYYGTYRGEVSADGKTITLTDNSSGHGMYGTLTAGVLSVGDGKSLAAKSISLQGMTFTDFLATINGDDDSGTNDDPVEGTWDATWTCFGGNNSTSYNYGAITEVVTISKKEGTDNEYDVVNMFTLQNMGTQSTNYTATLTGTTLTVQTSGESIDLTVSDNQLSYNNTGTSNYPKVGEWFYTNNYSATRRN